VRNFYIPIEPSFLHSVSNLLPYVETKLIDLIDGLETDPTTDKERADVIKKMLATIAIVKPPGVDIASMTKKEGSAGGSSKLMTFLNTDFTAQKKMKSSKVSRNIPITPDWKDHPYQGGIPGNRISPHPGQDRYGCPKALPLGQ